MRAMIAWPRLLRFGPATTRAPVVAMSDRAVRAAGQLHEEIDGTVVLLGRKSGDYVGLNEVGSAIWHALEREVRVADLCDTMAAAFGVAPETLQDDVTAFLGQLLDQELILITPAQPPSALRA